MFPNRFPITLRAGIPILVFLVFAFCARAAELGLTRVTSVHGAVRYQDQGHSVWTDIREGNELAGNLILQTGKEDANADLAADFSGGKDFRIGLASNSVLKISRAGQDKADHRVFELAKGEMRLTFPALVKADFTLKSGTNVFHVTIAQTSSGGPTEMLLNDKLRVIKGAAKIALGHAERKVIHAGEALPSDAFR